MDTSAANTQGMNDSFVSLYLDKAEPVNLQIFAQKVIKLIRVKFDLEIFRDWLKNQEF